MGLGWAKMKGPLLNVTGHPQFPMAKEGGVSILRDWAAPSGRRRRRRRRQQCKLGAARMAACILLHACIPRTCAAWPMMGVSVGAGRRNDRMRYGQALFQGRFGSTGQTPISRCSRSGASSVCILFGAVCCLETADLQASMGLFSHQLALGDGRSVTY